MQKITLLAGIALVITACNSNTVSYTRMNDSEIAAHNATADTWDQVYCVREIRLGSNIRKRYCATLRELQEGTANQVGVLNALNSGSGGFITN